MKRAASHAMNDSNGDAAKNDDRGDRKRPRLPSTAVRATEDARWLLPPPGQRIPATTGGDMFPYARAARLPRNAAQDSDLLQELLLRYGGPTQPRLSTTLAPTDLLSSATSLTDPFYHRALSATTPNLSEAQLRLQLAAMSNPSFSVPDSVLAHAQLFGASDARLQSMEAQVQQNQNRLLRELATLQMLDRRPPLWRTDSNGALWLDGVLPQLTAPREVVDNTASHAASLLGQRGVALAAAAGMTPEQYLNHLIATAGIASSNSSSRSLVAERPPSPRRTNEATAAPATVPSSSTKVSKRKAPPLVVDANYDPGVVKDLSLPSDPENLSEYQCLLRQQIVLFAVSLPDIQCSAQGRNKPITLGQVGVLCRYCAKIPPGMRPCGAVYFPAKLSGLYQASQNMAINHFSSNCQSIPEAIRAKLLQLKERKSTVLGGGKHFWANGARVLGVVEHENQLRFAGESGAKTAVEEK